MNDQAHVTALSLAQDDDLSNVDSRSATNGIVVLGIGNLLMGDDGAGVHVIERLKNRHQLPPDVSLVDGGTIGFTLLEQVESADTLIIVDAMQTTDAPGTVHVFADEALDEFLAAPTQRSVHDANVGDVLRMSALRGTLPRRRLLVAITVEEIGWNTTPTAAVVAGIEAACNEIGRIVEEEA